MDVGRSIGVAVGEKHTSHNGPNTGDQINGLGFDAGGIIGCAEGWVALCATPSDYFNQLIELSSSWVLRGAYFWLGSGLRRGQRAS